MQRSIRITVLIALSLSVPGCAANDTHVLLIGVDGMSPAGIEAANTPVIDKLCASGACTFEARGVLPTKSSPNWTSMVSGAPPTLHGVTSNKWQRDQRSITPAVTGSEDIFPTIFGTLRQQRPDAVIGVVHDWPGFILLVESSALDLAINADDERAATRAAVEFIGEKQPQLLFVHIDHVDRAGHDFGHGTAEYIAALESADALIGKMVDAVRSSAAAERTAIIVSADHGGVGTGHGGESMDELLIPVIMNGAGIANTDIESTVNIFDIAATIATLLGIEQPDAWVGRPVCDALGQQACLR